MDFWSIYIGGDEEFIAALESAVPTVSQRVGLEDRLEIED